MVFAQKLLFRFIIRLQNVFGMSNGKGWFVAMAITVALVYTGVSYLFPWH